MFRGQEDKNLYFSTKVELKINNIIYRPSICYKVPSLAKKSLEQYAASGKVTFYPSPVRFVNGTLAVLPAEQAVAVPSVVDETAPVKTTKRKEK